MRKILRPRALAAIAALGVLAWAGFWLWSFIFGPGAISAGIVPSALAMSPDGRYLYVAGDGPTGSALSSGGIAVIDTESRAVVKTIRIGANPAQLAIARTGNTLYIAPPEYSPDAWLARAVLPSGQVGKQLKFPGTVDSMVMSPDGKMLYVFAQKGRAELMVPILASSGVMGHAVTLPDSTDQPSGIDPFTVAVGDDGMIYVASQGVVGHSDQVYSIDALSGSLEKVASVDYWVTGLQVSADGRNLWAIGDDNAYGANGPRALILISLPGMKVVRETSLGPTPDGIAVDPSGRVVFISGDDDRGYNSVEVIDAASGHVEASLRTGPILANSPQGDVMPGGSGMVLSPDGKTLYAVNNSGKIAVLSVAGYTGH